jgi:signal transduction histidine kinase/phage shock protein PspC (stress-responsive transcriptional regulator)
MDGRTRPAPPAAGPRPSAAPHAGRWQVPRLRREGRLIGGVAAGIADEIGIDPLWARLAFVGLTAAGGWGAVIYGATWAALSIWEQRHPTVARPPEPKASGPTTRLVGFLLVVVGLIGFLRQASYGVGDRVAAPVGLLAMGALLAWHRGRLDPAWAAGRAALVRIGAGVALAAAGITGFTLLNVDLTAAGNVVLVTLALVAGIGLLLAPWAAGLLRDLGEERRARIRSEERARMAAHLHDSVLQTLALIQRNAHDPTRMTSLARRQERELRAWLYGGREPGTERGLRAALEGIAIEVEQLHGVPVEVVVVGDGDTDERVDELLAAAREAMVNAAKHSGAARVDVFAEIRPDLVEVFVRDTGKGFDPDAVPADRAGLRSSILDRMARAGGEAVVDSAPGEGAEVELRLARSAP